MKKQLLTLGAIALFGTAFAQGRKLAPSNNAAATHKTVNPNGLQRCSTPTPSTEWDAWFNQKVEEFKAQEAARISQGLAPTALNYTLPVVVHVIHNGESVGTGSNISQTQINSQITILNNDYAGTGLNATNVPAAFASLKANTGISFCMALTDPLGNTLAEPGIHRVNRNTAGFTAPPYSNTTYIDNTIKPATIWDPTKYCNMWVVNLGGGLLGYATFPVGTGLAGITGNGSATTDGVVMGYNYFGNSGSGNAPYHLGRTTSHEVGHWLGLRHINGDSNCGNDFCNDTPPQDQLHGGCPTHPYHTNTCGAGTSPNGEMFMNFMDYTDDACMYMFTNDQNTRMQTAMANGTYRKFLGTHGLCNSTPQPPVANFNVPAQVCQNVAAAFTDASVNAPNSWSWAVSPSAGVTINTATSQNPNITFANAGNYTVTLTATNAQGNNSISKPVTVTNCALTTCDTINNMTNMDTLTAYGPTLGSGYFGWVSGNNTYGDVEKAEYYSSATLSNTQITGAMVLFFKSGTLGTKGTGACNLKLYNGNNTTGPAGGAIATANATLTNILANTPVNNVQYVADPTVGYLNPIIYQHKYTFATPQNTPASGFLLSVVLPTTVGDTAVVFQNGLDASATNTAWELWSPSGWYAFSNTSSWGSTASLAILPIVCPTTGIGSNELGQSISIFPNPSNGNFNFGVSLDAASDLKFEIYNAVGQMVYNKTEKNVKNEVINLNLQNVGKGIFFVTITNSENVKTIKKIVIE